MKRFALAGLLLITATIHAQEPGAAAPASINVTRKTNCEKWFLPAHLLHLLQEELLFSSQKGGNGPSTFDPFTPSHN